MKKQYQYTFSILRYFHDVIGGEFVNVGLAIYSPELNFFDIQCTKRYTRMSKFFTHVNGEHFKLLMNHIEFSADKIKFNLENELPFQEKPKHITELLHKLIPPDDSSLQFSSPGGGISSGLEKTLGELYFRYIEKYYENKVLLTRDDEEVWKVFRKPLLEKKVVQHLKPHKIIAKNFEYEFKHAWKNGAWRTLEAVSFDLDNPNSITDKANKWLGRSISLAETDEKFILYLLLGEPTRKELMPANSKAENILHKINRSVKHEFIREHEASKFADDVLNDIKEHNESH